MEPEANKEYSVNWKNHMSHVRKAFDQLLNANELTDVTLCCEGRKIGAHKMLLSACSAYFRDTFKEVPSQHPVIILYGVEYSVLSDILHFIYNGEVSVDTSKLDTFLKIAQLLQISGLTDDPGKITQNEGTAAMTATPYQTTTEETYSETNSSPAPSDEAKRGVKRIRTKEVEPPKDKIQRQENDTLFISDVKCEPTELVNFEDPLEDPLQSDQPQDAPELFGTGTSQSTGDEDFKNMQDVEEVSRLNLFTMSQEMQYMEAMAQDLTVTPEEVKALALEAKESLLPKKSKELYEAEYNAYREWCLKMKIEKTTEDTILEYFNSSLARYKSSSLLSKYSMLRSTINLREEVDISKFPAVISFLKSKADGYKPKKSLSLTRENIDVFLNTADDEYHLLNKVILIFGIAGACKRQELASLLTTNVQDCLTHFLVKIVDPEAETNRSFIILPAHFGNFNVLEVIRNYITLRSPKTSHNRFFVNCMKKKCTVQPVGVHKIASVPAAVAKFLNLKDHALYTGNCFRRTSATLLGSPGRRGNY